MATKMTVFEYVSECASNNAVKCQDYTASVTAKRTSV